jgi:hypothetical protein
MLTLRRRANIDGLALLISRTCLIAAGEKNGVMGGSSGSFIG